MSEELLWNRASPAHATLVLAHGAGAPMDSPFMETVARGLAQQGVSVVRFEFPYMHERRSTGKRSPPNPMPRLEARFREVVACVPREAPLFVGGKSLGSRVATLIADEAAARGVIALGYPFHPPKQPSKLRLAPLQALRAPCLIVQGTRDALGSREEVERYALPANIRVHWLEDGDHSFEPRKASGHTADEHLRAVVASVAAFIARRSGSA